MAANTLRDRGLSALIASDLEIWDQGFQFTEGPLWLADDSLLFQDIKAESTYRLSAGRKAEVVRHDTQAANGQTFDSQGRIIFCEQNGRRMSRMKPDGTGYEIVLEQFQGKRLNSPNDVVVRRDGSIYFTDPNYGLPSPDAKEISYQAVFRLDPDGKNPQPIITDMEKPNGLAFSPDGSTLYVCDTGRYHVRAFDLDNSGWVEPSSERIFATMDPGEPGGPDGMKIDAEGRVYVAVALGIWVYEPSGELLGIIATPKRPSNLAWGGPEGRDLAITMIDFVCRITLKTRGEIPPFRPNT